MPKLVAQTVASQRMNLFGDRNAAQFKDTQPVDGIDDSRAAVLSALAERFSPILRRNNFSVPRDFHAVLGGNDWIRIDYWQDERHVRSDSVALGGPLGASARLLASGEDQKLIDLLQRFSPWRTEFASEPAEARTDVTLYIDYPGHDQRSWRSAYGHVRGNRAYVHPFVHEDTSAGVDRYALVLQYWFFYPFNDGANNHEGDWEHLSVVLTTRAQECDSSAAAARLGEAEIQRILSGELPADSLSIAMVEYYFHETYVLLDYVEARRAAQATGRFSEFLHFHIWEEPDFINRVIRERLSDARLATHPIGYIGGNNRGPDELTQLLPRFQAAYNRNGHGTFPFSGVWQAVGALGSTEQLAGELVPAWKEGPDGAVVFDDNHFISFRRDDLVLVPDWEAVWPDMMADPTLRHAWAWLVLPLRWGFPTSRSPGARALKHVDLGNISPEGPAFQPTWNRLASASGWPAYDPSVLRVLLVPATPWARVRNGWGILNLPLGLLGFLPGINVITTQVTPWLTGTLNVFGVEPPRNFYPGKPAFRYSSSGVGIVRTSGGATLGRFLKDVAEEEGVDIDLTGSVSLAEPWAAPRLWFNVFYGRSLSVENTFVWSRAELSYAPAIRDYTAPSGLTGTIDFRELTSGFRMNVVGNNDDVVQFYSRAGWGYAWYHLRDDFASSGTTLAAKSDRDGGYRPTLLPSKRWWPNTGYLGLGVEVFSPKDRWVLRRIGLGVRAETSVSWHRVGATGPSLNHLGWARRGEYAVSATAAW